MEGCARRGAACILGRTCATGRAARAAPSASACRRVLPATGKCAESATPTWPPTATKPSVLSPNNNSGLDGWEEILELGLFSLHFVVLFELWSWLVGQTLLLMYYLCSFLFFWAKKCVLGDIMCNQYDLFKSVVSWTFVFLHSAYWSKINNIYERQIEKR